MAVTTRRGTLTPRCGSGTPQVPPVEQVQPPAQPNVPQEGPRFALTPALATRGIIDYSTRAGERIYMSATKELDSKKYDGEAQGLMAFLELLEERATNFGWDSSIMMIPTQGENTASLLTEYGTITIDQVRAHEETYITSQSRTAQDTNLLYECIMNSIILQNARRNWPFGSRSTNVVNSHLETFL